MRNISDRMGGRRIHKLRKAWRKKNRAVRKVRRKLRTAVKANKRLATRELCTECGFSRRSHRPSGGLPNRRSHPSRLQRTFGLKRDVTAIDAFAVRAKSNRITTEDTISNLSNLVALADPSTVAEFDALLATTIADIEKLDTPLFERFGAPDGLRKVKADALAQLNSLVHNNFATGGDISAVQAALNNLSADFGGALVITRINENAGLDLSQNTNAKIADLDAEIAAIKLGAQAEKIDVIERERARAAQILTALSLSFEASKALTDYITQATIFEPEVDPGSILNLFT